MQVIRAAITAKNTKESIFENTKRMLLAIFEKNDVKFSDIISIHFTATKELDAVYPAVAARELGITEAALFCTQEMAVKNSLAFCLRCAVMLDNDKKQSVAVHVYLEGAAVLRPDLSFSSPSLQASSLQTSPLPAYSVAIDGPAGSGKSTVAKEIAKRRQLIYVDTGAMYRAVGLYCQRQGINTCDLEAVTAVLPNIKLDIKLSDANQKIILNDEDVTVAVRTQEAGKAASEVAALLPVRQKLLEIQRNLAKGRSVVMDGRDIGSNVLPDALVKIYLDASVNIRACRRLLELQKMGEPASLEKVEKQIKGRDESDKNRSHNPLCKAADAITLDTSGMDITEATDALIEIIDAKVKLWREAK